MELDVSFDIQLGRLELPNRAVELHGRKADGSQCMQEVTPRVFARRG